MSQAKANKPYDRDTLEKLVRAYGLNLGDKKKQTLYETLVGYWEQQEGKQTDK